MGGEETQVKGRKNTLRGARGPRGEGAKNTEINNKKVRGFTPVAYKIREIQRKAFPILRE